ncbi:MAG: hypothetical protein IKH88_05930 [Prevotella sp.]|nr:hypothetical protein [Prevotella sp.]
MAQNIAVVSPNNVTDIYQTLGDAITNATSGSTIYLPGGGLQISEDIKIDKKLTILGVSHRGDTDNADGGTIISGNLFFIDGSSGSAVMGVYISGDIYVGTAEDAVENFTVKKCNANSIQVGNSASSGMVVNQCYLRGNSNFGGCNVKLENNIMCVAWSINVGVINHNVFVANNYFSFINVYNSSITNNFFVNAFYVKDSSGCYVSHNCIGTASWDWDENPITLDEGQTWDDVFGANNNKGVTIASDYTIKKKSSKFLGTDGTTIGIEGGSTGFDPNALAPIPRIISKKVDEQSDASGKLTIEVTVKAQ